MGNRDVLLKGYRNPYAKNVVVIEYFTVVITWRQAVFTTKLITSPLFPLPGISFKGGGEEQVYVACPGTHVQSIAPIDRRDPCYRDQQGQLAPRVRFSPDVFIPPK